MPHPRRRHLPLLPSLCLVLAPAAAHAADFDQHAFTPSHDTFIQRANPSSTAGGGGEFLVKRDSATASGGSDRLGYLRFTTAAPYSVVDSASLHITINEYPGNGSTPFTFEVFGLPDATLLIRTDSDSLAVANTTASSTLTGSAAANATDSNFTTRWIASADTSSTKSWITLDLGSPQSVNRLNFIAYQHGRSYKLESSDDQSTWSLIASNFGSGTGSDVNTLLQGTNRYFQLRTARYFRLSSLTSTTGNSLSIWEVKLYNESAAAAPLARIESLTTSVSLLPNSTNPEQLKRVVLELALERAQACIATGDFAAAKLLLDDAENNLATDPAAMAAVATGVTQVRTIRPLIETTPETNPYLKRINDGAALFLGTSDSPWEKNTPDLNVLADFNTARSTARRMESLLWAFAHPNSAMRHHPAILRRLLRRTYAYLDAINVHGPFIPAGQLASFYDDFASSPASIVFREFQLLYPGLIPENSNIEWDNAMTTAANNLWSAYRNRTASWVNTDAAIAVELHNFGMKTGRQELIDKGRYFIDDILTSGRMFADGAVGYIGTQNEAGGYQSTVEEYVNRYYQITDRPQALEVLRKMEWYGPINGPMFDWWTSPSWKHAWNLISGSGQTGEATNGKNPFTRAGLDAAIAAPATTTNWFNSTVEVGWYERGTIAQPPPDTYILFDRNIQGPRAWQGGRWHTTGTLRAINNNESGHHTIMGAQVMDPPPNVRVNASVMGVFPRIRTDAGSARYTDGTFATKRHAWLTTRLTGASTVASGFSAIGVSHKIHVYGSSTKGTEHDWTARQVWLNLPDRTLGLLDLSPNANLSAYEVQGAIRLGFGGTAHSSTKTLVATGPDAWSYGNLRIKLHDHNYAEVVPEEYEFRRPQAPITEITLRDQIGGGANTTLNTYTAGTRWKYITELRPHTSTGEVTVTEAAEAGGLIGLNVEYPDSNKRYQVLYNPGAGAVVHTPALDWPGTMRLYRSGAHFRPDWVPDPAAEPEPESITNGQAVTLQPKAHVVIENTTAPLSSGIFNHWQEFNWPGVSDPAIIGSNGNLNGPTTLPEPGPPAM